jgi:hypothetical protein
MLRGDICSLLLRTYAISCYECYMCYGSCDILLTWYGCLYGFGHMYYELVVFCLNGILKNRLQNYVA